MLILKKVDKENHGEVTLGDTSLIPVGPKSYNEVMPLMKRIYPPVYAYLWTDRGHHYLQKTYHPANVSHEVSMLDSDYYFINTESKQIGILKVDWNHPLTDDPILGAKLHRIYMDTSFTGKGIGEVIMTWVEEECRNRGCSYIWLEAMDSSEQALRFYRSRGLQKIEHFQFEESNIILEYGGMWRMVKML